MTYPTDNWPTQPVVWRHELPHCAGACSQGRMPCPHPLACSVRCADETERADVDAELTTDRMPLLQSGAQGELPTVTGRLMPDEEEATPQENALFIALLAAAFTAWVVVVWNLILLWRAAP